MAHNEAFYYEGAAIAIIVLSSLSFLALSFVVGVYVANWKKIASFPMRLVQLSLQ